MSFKYYKYYKYAFLFYEKKFIERHEKISKFSDSIL